MEIKRLKKENYDELISLLNLVFSKHNKCTMDFERELPNMCIRDDVHMRKHLGLFVDNKLVLEASDDAASVILGGQWRMPTAEERDELLDEKKCHWEYVTVNGVKGARITSKIVGYTDRSIFLPAAGYQMKAIQAADQEAGNYWCSSICTQTQYTDAPSNACALTFSVTQKMNGYAWQKRFHGNNIRPVHP